MNYKIYNNNSEEWVLLIHGLGGSINTWKYQIKDLSEYNVIAVDLEGHGGSSFEKRRVKSKVLCKFNPSYNL